MVIEVNRLDERVDQFRLVPLVLYVALPERFKPKLYLVLWYVHQRGSLDGDRCLQAAPLVLQLDQPLLGGGGDDALLDSGHHILYRLFYPVQLLLRRQQHGVLAVELQEVVVAVHQPLDNLVLHDVLLGGLGYLLLDPVPAHRLFAAGLFLALGLAVVVVVLGRGLAGTRHSHHKAPTVAAEQFPRQEIVAILPVPPLGVLFRFQLLLHRIEQLLSHDGRHSVLHPVPGVLIHPDIPLVDEYPVKAPFVPEVPGPGLYPPAVEVIADVNQQIPRIEPLEDLPDYLSLFRLDLIPPIIAPPVPIREGPVDHALLGIVHHAPHDILGHVLGVELVDVHHIAEGKAAGGGVVEILLGVEAADTHVSEPGVVHHSVQHIAPHAV